MEGRSNIKNSEKLLEFWEIKVPKILMISDSDNPVTGIASPGTLIYDTENRVWNVMTSNGWAWFK